ncbi:TetR/AcrR family transcriptional regulator [Saccharothrix coeruleofusca]|nr:TetR/AcrR family transcriptional regulator [Saccharothrix coeruleofusca]
MPDRRPMRVDAARNRDRVLSAAREAVARGDTSLQLNELARRAGVGVGTVYRNFPTRQALLEALSEDRLLALLAEASAALAEADPSSGLRRLLRAVLDVLLADEAFAEVLAIRQEARSAAAGLKTRFDRAAEDLITRAREAGALRADVDAEDLRLMVCGVVHAARNNGGDTDSAAERYLAVLMAGLRPDPRSAVPRCGTRSLPPE